MATRVEVESLNTNFNFNMIIARKLFGTLPTRNDRELVRQWIRKLKSCTSSINEMKLRNNFMFHLVINLRTGCLLHPFNKPPKQGPLNMAYASVDQCKGSDSGSDADSERAPRNLPQPPPAARFLVPAPMPKVGAVCYMAMKCMGDNVSK
ncbi:uncharacterized protein LOC134530364 [Bacillus rossius redtenbacheri]|uniref:uncharacterized protein LOC134530364 n=1 Tax=Bacillus rossius redtenbacheri TaxID=93214 RepID=UPI002FDDEEB5